MTSIVFRRRAQDDLRQIIEWYEEIAPEAVVRILADINRALDQLIQYPRSAPHVAGRRFRRIVTRRYYFKIAYQVEGERIVVLGIYRYQNRES